MADTREYAGDFSQSLSAHILYLSSLAALIVVIPADALHHLDRAAVLAIGVLGTWRYGWGLLHLIRALYYQHVAFPRMRRQAQALAASAEEATHAYFLVTSFRISSETSLAVYRAVFAAALAHPGRSTIVASIVEMGDQRLVKALFNKMVGDGDSRITLALTRIAGTGKRDALAFGFRAISASVPGPAENDIAMVIDGDSVVPSDIVARCAPLLRLDPSIGALTTDELSEVQGGNRLFHHWYSMRFAQRHLLMSSMGLAGRVLTLTGRMSMFRASLVCNPDFVQQIENDYIDHWRIGRYRLLTGDDKSSWFWLLKKGYRMLYVPDVVVRTVEELPSTAFVPTSLQLMSRWFGNMLRTNGRAIAVGPGRIGFFTWWCLIDQRLSMWTSLAGCVFAVLAAMTYSWWALAIYVAWVMASRYLLTLLFLLQRDEISVLYPFLLWYNQIVGSLVKTYVLTHPYKQKWTRQKTHLSNASGRLRDIYVAASSHAAHAVAIVLLVTAVAMWSRALPPPIALLN